MAQIITIVNQKGGSGKTSAAVNLCCAIAAAHRRVLLIDFDPTGSATVGLREKRTGGRPSLAEALAAESTPGAEELLALVVHSEGGGFDLLPSGDELTAAAVQLQKAEKPLQALKSVLAAFGPAYDLIVVDTPPSLDLLTLNALCACDGAVVPVPCEYLALNALDALIKRCVQLQAEGQMTGQVLGIVRMMYEDGVEYSTEIKERFEVYKELLFESVIPYSTAISEAAAYGRPVMYYDKSSSGARQYLALAGELMRRLKL